MYNYYLSHFECEVQEGYTQKCIINSTSMKEGRAVVVDEKIVEAAGGR